MLNINVVTGLGAAIDALHSGAHDLRVRYNLNDHADDYEALARLLAVIQKDGTVEPGDPRYTPDPLQPSMEFVYRFLLSTDRKGADLAVYRETATALDAWQTGVKKK